MNSKISFYSFKHTDNNVTTRKFRKDRESYFDQFQRRRVVQKLSSKEGKNKQRAASLSVLVRSEQEMQLLNFFKLPNLRKSKSKDKKQGKCHEEPQIASKSPLEKILNNKNKFMKTYFSRLHKYEKNHHIKQVKHVFPDILMEQWTIKGYLMDEYIMLKAIHASGRQRYLKYKYSKYVEEIKTSYEQFVKEKFEDYVLTSYAM